MTPTDKDAELLALLRINAREPTASLARKLGLSRSTVQDRLARLEDQGVIAGYTVRLQALAAVGFRAYVGISVEPKRLNDVIAATKKILEIDRLDAVSGELDLMAVVNVDTPAALDKLLDRLSELPGVGDTESLIVLSTKFDRG